MMQNQKKNSVKINLCRYPTSKKSDSYDFKIALFDNGNPGGFFLFMGNFLMNIKKIRRDFFSAQ